MRFTTLKITHRASARATVFYCCLAVGLATSAVLAPQELSTLGGGNYRSDATRKPTLRTASKKPVTTAISVWTEETENEVAAQQAIVTLNFAIQEAEQTGLDTRSFRIAATNLNELLLNRNDSFSEIAAEASGVTMKVIEQLNMHVMEAARTDANIPHLSNSSHSQTSTYSPFQHGPLWLGIVAVAIAAIAVLVTPLLARRAVARSLREAGLI